MVHDSIPKRDALTRIEVIVAAVTSIFTAAFMLVYFDRSRHRSDYRTDSQTNLKQIVIASISFADQHNGIMPTGQAPDIPFDELEDGFVLGTCLYQILPQMDNEPLFKQGSITIGNVQGFASWLITEKPFKPYQAPHDPTLDTRSDRTSYLANELAFPAMKMKFPDSYSDGPAQTIFFTEAHSEATETVERDGSFVRVKVKRHWWDKPVWCPVLGPPQFELDVKPGMANASLPQGFTRAGMQVGLGDGSVRNMPLRMNSTATFYNACTPAGNDELGDDW